MATKKKAVKKKVETILTLYSPHVEVAMKEISKIEFDLLRKEGIDDSELDDLFHSLLEDTIFSSSIADEDLSPTLEVVTTDKEVEEYDLLDMYDKAAKKVKVKKAPKAKGKYYVVQYQYMKRGQYALKIKGDFDMDKLELDVVSCTDIPTGTVYGFDLSYNGEFFDIEDLGHTNYMDLYLLTSAGKRYEIVIN